MKSTSLKSAFFALMLSAFVASTSMAQAPEHFYFQFNEGIGSSTVDLASPGLGSSPTFNSQWGSIAEATLGANGLLGLGASEAPDDSIVSLVFVGALDSLDESSWAGSSLIAMTIPEKQQGARRTGNRIFTL